MRTHFAQIDFQNLAIQEQNRVQRLILRRCRNIALNRQIIEERGKFRAAMSRG